jgi:putative membrane protein
MRKFKSLYLLLVFAVLIQACDDNQRAKNYNNKTLVDDNGLNFIKTATEAGLTEVKAAQLAESVSKNQRVIAFAKMMVTDHSQAGKELTELADKKFVSPGDSLNADHKKALNGFGKLSPDAFDKAYMKMMITDHEQAVTLFENAGRNKNSDIQSFAKKTSPTLKMHLDSAKAIYASLK